MPIFEYVCKQCKNHFEVIVRNSTVVKCQKCGSKKLEKLLSVFNASAKGGQSSLREMPAMPCNTCGDPRGPGSCSMS
jgi:putative FmdB family regulatory protein